MAPPSHQSSEPTGADHLDDLALNAHHDGDADHGTHLSGCDLCRGRLEALRGVSSAVAAPPPAPEPARADTLIATAMAAWDDMATAGRAGDREATRTTAPVVTLHRRQQRRITWLAAAAVVLAALVAVPVLSQRSNRSDDSAALRQTADAPMTAEGEDNAFAAGSAEASGAGGTGPTADAATEALPAGPVNDGDIGDHGDFATVAGIVRARLEGPSAQEPTAPPVTAACEDTARARARAPGLGELAYVASLRWEGTPAEALVFRSTGASDGYELVILARSGCAVLAQGRT